MIKQYPRPWGPDVHDKIAFTLGFLSHSVADTSWHSLGMREGFIEELYETEYGTGRNEAHGMADTGRSKATTALCWS